MNKLLLLFISVFPVFAIGRYIYLRDKDKEPFGLLFKLFLGGIGSCICVIFLSMILSRIFPILQMNVYYLNFFDLIIYVFIFIAFLEEFCKWFFVYRISYCNVNFDRLYDMIVYSVFVSLGFACIENILYVFEKGFLVGVVRAILAVPGHACDGVFMGYHLGMSKYHFLHGNKEKSRKSLILSIVVPSILHGIYDFCLFSRMLLFFIIFVIFIITLFVLTMKKIKTVSSINGRIKYVDNFCSECGRKVDSDFCPTCGRKNY